MLRELNRCLDFHHFAALFLAVARAEAAAVTATAGRSLSGIASAVEGGLAQRDVKAAEMRACMLDAGYRFERRVVGDVSLATDNSISLVVNSMSKEDLTFHKDQSVPKDQAGSLRRTLFRQAPTRPRVLQTDLRGRLFASLSSVSRNRL